MLLLMLKQMVKPIPLPMIVPLGADKVYYLGAGTGTWGLLPGITIRTRTCLEVAHCVHADVTGEANLANENDDN